MSSPAKNTSQATSMTDAVVEGRDLTWSTELDPALSEQKWTQFTKDDSPTRNSNPNSVGASGSGLLGGGGGNNTIGTSGLTASSPKPVDGNASPIPQSGGLTATQTIFAPAPPPGPAVSAQPQVGSSQTITIQPQPSTQEPTILYPVGTGANGAPLFMALTPSQLAAVGGNPQNLLHGATLPQAVDGHSPQQGATINHQQHQQQQQQTMSSGFVYPMAGVTNLVPVGAPGGVQLICPPGMNVPIPVPLATMQVKAAVGVPTTPKYQSPMPAGVPGRPMGPLLTPSGRMQMAKTPSMATPVLLPMPGVAAPMQMHQVQTPPHSGPFSANRTHGGDVVGEQMVWAAHEHLFHEQAPTLGEVRSLAGSSQSNNVTPLAASARAGPAGTPQAIQKASGSGNPSPTAGSRKPTKQEMLLQQLQASHPSTTLPAPDKRERKELAAVDADLTTGGTGVALTPSASATAEGGSKWSQRAELEERLVGKLDAQTPNGPGPLSASSTPVAAWKAKPCKSFLQTGTCKYGDKCVFSHEKEGSKEEPKSAVTSSS